MCKFKNNGEHNRIDKCIKPLIKFLNNQGIYTYSSCCGHNKYPLTIIGKDYSGNFIELLSGIKITRTRKFYKKDKRGYYYIPEIINKNVKIKTR